jgi:mono/diheme cytochrome c family protein
MTSALLAAGLLGLATAPARLEAQRSGVEIWSQTCGRCHMPQPAIRYTADQWESIMMDMAIFARMTDDDAAAVLEFLKGGAKRVASADPVPREGELLAVLASVGPVEIPPPRSQDGAGATLYAQNCSACHGKAGKGDGAAAAALNPRPTNLADSTFQASRTDPQLTEAITNGKGTMPGNGARLGQDGVRALVAYIRSLGNGKGR